MGLRMSAVLVLLGYSAVAVAQDDEELAPLAPISKPRPKPKPKTLPKPKVGPVKSKSPSSAQDVLVPLAANGELVVKVAAELEGSALTIDGRLIGVLPLPAQNVASGEHSVAVKRPGYATFVRKVLVQAGSSVEVEAKLIAVAAVLSVTSELRGGQVLLNGRPIGTVPLTDVEVPPGPAEVAIIKEGFREEARRINFVAGKEYPLVIQFTPLAPPTTAPPSDRPQTVSLIPSTSPDESPVAACAPAPQPLTGKWYFWAGVAVAAAAAGFAAGALATGGFQPAPLSQTDMCGPGGCDGIIGGSTTAGRVK